MAPSRRALAGELVRASRALHARGWVANHDGNVTARLAGGRFLCTPTATSKASVEERLLLEVDDGGTRVAGTTRPFGELPMHLALYRGRPDVGAVVHAHPPHATALACSGSNLIERPFLPEAVVSLGPRIPLLPFAPPGKAAADALASVVGEVDAALCASHGVFAWGADVEQALLRMELVEHLARIATLAQATGGVRPLPASALPPLLASRARAGLGAAADRAAELADRPVVACAPAPHATVTTIPPGAAAEPGDRAVVASAPAPHAPVATIPPGAAPAKSSDLARLIREELMKALRDR